MPPSDMIANVCWISWCRVTADRTAWLKSMPLPLLPVRMCSESGISRSAAAAQNGS
jgi:hypothetical protein